MKKQNNNILTFETQTRKRRWPLITGISAGAVFGILVILLFLIPTIVSTNMAKNRIINALETNLDRKVEIDDIRMSWSDGLDVRNILIKEREGVPGDAFVKVDRFYCNIRFFPLIKKQIRIRELIIDSPEVVVHRYRDTVFKGDDSKVPKPKPSPETERGSVPEVTEKKVEEPAFSALALPFALDVELNAKINNGKFTFIDHRIREKTVINNLNTMLKIESLDKPIELKSTFGIEAKGETEQADISMNLSLVKDGEVNPKYARGSFQLKTSFAQVITDFDMTKFTGDGAKGLELNLHVDTKGLTDKLAGILGLPEGLQVEGVCNSKITASGRFDKLINVDGNTELVNLTVSGGPLKDKPIKELNVKLLQSADIDIVNDEIKIYRFGFDSAFAQTGITGLVTDMRSAGNLDLKMYLNCDMARLVSEMGGLLPEGVAAGGNIQTNMTIQGDRKKSIIDGKTVIKDLFFKQDTFGPLSEPEILITHNVTCDILDKSLLIKEFGLTGSSVEMRTSGALNHEKEIFLNVFLAVKDLKKLVDTLAGIVSLPQGLKLSGKTVTEMKVKGDREKGITLSGKTNLNGVNVAGGPLKDARISNLSLILMHTLEHDMARDMLHVERLDVVSDFLDMKSKGEIKNLSQVMDIDYGASLNLNLDESTKLFADLYPENMMMTGKGSVDFALRGKLPADLKKIDELDFHGNVSVDKVKYGAYNITDLKSAFRLDDGIFATEECTFGLNEGEGKIFAKAILKEEKPPTEFSLNLTDVHINQKMDILAYIIPILSARDGEMSGKLNMDISAQGKGLDWQEELSKTLKAEGNISIRDGLIKGDKILSQIIRHEAFQFDELTAPIKVEDGKIFTENVQVNGREFDIGLSGWTSFDGRMEYMVESEAVAKYLGGDAEKILGMLGKGSKLPIVITGTVEKPRITFKLPKSEKGIGGILEGIGGELGRSKQKSEKTETVEKKEESKSGEPSKEAQPEEIKKEKIKKEEIVEKLLKDLFK
ncbi:MAG: AsmA family protein [Candidatus Scalindua sp.]|nr:AsmA family protein [Candidatus Scalindua sp.]